MKANIAQNAYVPGTSRGPRSIRTVLLQMARAEDERAKARGDRIRELRGSVPQPRIAEQVGVTLRAYQEWEAGGGIGWDNLVKLAETFGVSEEYVEYGVSGRPRPGTDLGRLERKLDALLVHAGIDPAGLDADAAADIEHSAKRSTSLLGGEAAPSPTARPVPARKHRAG